MSILDKLPKPDKSSASAEMCLEQCDWASEFPGLWEFLVRQMYEGNPRATGKIVVFTEQEKATVCLIDRATAQVSFFTGGTVDEALRGSDAALLAGTLDWRKDKKAAYRR